MKKVLFLLSLLFVFIVSCGDDPDPYEQENSETPADRTDSADTAEEPGQADSSSDTEQGEPTDPTGDTEPAETPDENGNPDGSEQNEEPATEKFCQFACEKDSDCVQKGANAIADEDNYKCNGGKCVYLGCKSDAECDEVYAEFGEKYYCNENGAYGYPECTPACTTAADCAAGTSTESAFDSDNYKCENSRCVYAGCNSDSECQNGGLNSMRCVPEKYGEKTLSICVQNCTSPADCANAVYPAELYLCEDQLCKMKSCESDEWCAEHVNPKFSCL